MIGGSRWKAPSSPLTMPTSMPSGDEEAYLQADGEKQPTPPEPVDPASILCQFRGTSWEQVPMLFQARRRTMGPNTSAIAAVWICNECVAQWGRSSPQSPQELEGSTGGRLGPIAPDCKALPIRSLSEQLEEPRRRRRRSISRFLPRLLRSLANEARVVLDRSMTPQVRQVGMGCWLDAGGPGGQAADDPRMRPTNPCTARS